VPTLNCAVRGLVLWAALLAAACGGAGPGGASEAAWQLYLREPGTDTYENFIRVNRDLASRHGEPYDRTGIEYQLRAFDVMSREAARTSDAALAEEVSRFIADVESRDLAGVFEENVPGAKARLAEAKARVEPLNR